MMAQFQPSGVRLAFTTDASWIQLDTVRSRVAYAGAPARPDGVIEFTVTGEVLGSAVTSGGRTTTIEMWLPHNEVTELVALRTNAPVSAAPERGRPVWLHHGSSISQGSDATRPTAIWPAVAGRIGRVELTNLGFGGSALLDPFAARAMPDTPADVISIKPGISIMNLDLMRLRAFGTAGSGKMQSCIFWMFSSSMVHRTPSTIPCRMPCILMPKSIS